MKQGTVSVICGCHSPVHSLLVLKAWKKLYCKWPEPWEVACIFLHDIGHWGTDYLDDYEKKKEHWLLGAYVAHKLFGSKGYALLAGHSSHSGFPKSKLYKADKFSWSLAPYWWLWTNCVAEPKLQMGYTKREAIKRFRSQVKESLESGKYQETHQFYLDRCKKGGG